MKKSLADILIEQGAINSMQWNECKQEAQKSGTSVAQCLVRKGVVTSGVIAQAYADFSSLPLIAEITDKMADIELLAKAPLRFLRDNAIVPVSKDGVVYIVAGNPLNFQALDELNMLLDGQATYAVGAEPMIIEAINKYYPIEGTKKMIEDLAEEEASPETVAFEEIEEKDILTMASDAPIIKLVNHILYQAVKQGASDIHVEPSEKELRVRYRIDGVMQTVMTPPKRIQLPLISRIKIMANLNIAEKRVPQDGRIPIKVGDKAIDIRVSILPTTFGERVVMRLLDKSRSFAQLKDLGLSDRDYAVVERAISKPNGIVYVTGPTGSGKTTTLYSILSELNKAAVNIITVEDPVEYEMRGIGQVQVKEKVGMTFAAALRSILRQDPDIIMIGETRDQETAQIAIQSALTGHLVLTTLHTNDAPSTITRLLDMGVEPFLIASSINMALAQRLIRKLCQKCKKPYEPSEALLKQIGIRPEEVRNVTFYEAIGCADCLNTGYKGRMAIFEVMEMTDDIAQLTMEQADTHRLKKQAMKDGMTLLIRDGIRRIKEGVTTIEEVLSVATTDQTWE